MVWPWSLSSWTNAISDPSGENEPTPAFLMTPSQPVAGTLAPVAVSYSFEAPEIQVRYPVADIDRLPSGVSAPYT